MLCNNNKTIRLLINVRGLKDLEWSNKMIKITIPTEYSQNIFNNTKQMYNTIQDYFLMEDLVTIFSAIVNDIMNNYLVFFYNLKIETKIDAMRFF